MIIQDVIDGFSSFNLQKMNIKMIKVITKFIFLSSLFVFVLGEAPDIKTAAKYDPNELLLKIFNVNESTPRNYGSVGFSENNSKDYFHKGTLKFENELNDYSSEMSSQSDVIQFQDNNKESSKKRRKKKKPRQHYNLQNQAFRPNLGFNGIPNTNAFGGQYYRPPGPPPSIASEALLAITDALTSIALNDDHQCVARLLCEAAGGGALGSSGILQTISGLQPLLTLLSAYNGISTNPLFVFGRAVFLGMSSKGNTASCRYAYPLCPTDPEQLVHYLNNHNGGFFRFFKSPQHGSQNVEQFYNQLSQNYGLQNLEQQNYGFYNPQSQKYGLYNPNPYPGHGNQNYGLAYPYNGNNRFKNNDFNKDTEIQKRIQNKPNINISDDTKWTFPKNDISYVNNDDFRDDDFGTSIESERDKKLKFPESNSNDIRPQRETKGIIFPEGNRQYNYYDYAAPNTYNKKVYNHFYVNKNVHNVDDDLGVRTVYIVRGNGDPNKPEIIKLKPGETIQ